MEQSPARRPALVERAVCVSRARIDGSAVEEMLAERSHYSDKESRALAPRAWLFSGGWFLLWMEGSVAPLECALREAARDPRNAGFRLVHRSRGRATLSEGFLIAATQAQLPIPVMVEGVRRLIRSGGDLEPEAIWRSFAEPCGLRGADPWDAAAARDVAVVAAEDNGPVEQFQRLAIHCSSHMVYQRFAGLRCRSTDVGAAYVDLPDASSGFSRVRLLSRRALAHPLAHLALADLDALLLLLGSHPSNAIDVATAAAHCVNALARPPQLYIAGGEPAAIAACIALLSRCGASGARPALPLAGERLDTLLAATGIDIDPQPSRRAPREFAPAT